MLIPKMVRGQMQFIDGTPFEYQRKLQQGCNCGCGWAGDPFLVVRALPQKYSAKGGWAVLHNQPGCEVVIIYRSDQQQPMDPHVIDHRIVQYIADARRNHDNMKQTLKLAEAHDAKVELDQRKQQAEMVIGMSQMVGHHLRKEGKPLPKVDRKKK